MQQFPHFKRSKTRPHYSTFYKENGELAQDVIDHVAKFYQKEISYFDYKFEQDHN